MSLYIVVFCKLVAVFKASLELGCGYFPIYYSKGCLAEYASVHECKKQCCTLAPWPVTDTVLHCTCKVFAVML